MMPSSHVRPRSRPILIWMVAHLWVFGSSLAQVGSQEASAPPTLTVDAFAYWDASVRQGYVDILVERGDALGGDLLVSAFQLRREQGTPIRGPLVWSTTWRWDDALDSRFLTRILLPEGGYVVRAELTGSQQTLTREIPIRIDYPKPLAGLSDVMPMAPGEPPSRGSMADGTLSSPTWWCTHRATTPRCRPSASWPRLSATSLLIFFPEGRFVARSA